jgi:predicted transcriptional regulator|tara:strand:+ start:543 stop:836 length:294 start_codon:yes stop_codon:yes gene_type:complete
MSDIKTSKIVKLIEIFDQMSKDLSIGRLSNFEKDVLLNLHKETNNKKVKVNIKNINFLDYNGYTISKSTLYKALKSLCEKNLITHLGTKRSSIYKLN